MYLSPDKKKEEETKLIVYWDKGHINMREKIPFILKCVYVCICACDKVGSEING